MESGKASYQGGSFTSQKNTGSQGTSALGSDTPRGEDPSRPYGLKVLGIKEANGMLSPSGLPNLDNIEVIAELNIKQLPDSLKSQVLQTLTDDHAQRCNHQTCTFRVCNGYVIGPQDTLYSVEVLHTVDGIRGTVKLTPVADVYRPPGGHMTLVHAAGDPIVVNDLHREWHRQLTVPRPPSQLIPVEGMTGVYYQSFGGDWNYFSTDL